MMLRGIARYAICILLRLVKSIHDINRSDNQVVTKILIYLITKLS